MSIKLLSISIDLKQNINYKNYHFKGISLQEYHILSELFTIFL